jgi:hypothetical protein
VSQDNRDRAAPLLAKLNAEGLPEAFSVIARSTCDEAIQLP